MRVLFGHAYFQYFDPKLEEASRPYPPLGTLIAAALVREAGHEVTVFDAMLERSTAGWKQRLTQDSPDVAVLFEDNFNYLSKMCLGRMRDAAFEMLGHARDHGIPAIVVGSDASDHVEQFLDAGAVAVISGEGDEAVLDSLAALQESAQNSGEIDTGALESIPGLSVQDATGELVRGDDRPNMKALDSIPFAARDLVDMKRYRQIWSEAHGRVSVNMVTTRGCPYHCNWCSKPIWGQRYNARSPENVVEEMVEIRDKFGADHVWFADDIFGLKPGWIARFGELVAEHDVRIPFKCLSRPDLLVRKDTIELLADAGAEEVWIGAESGSQKVLDAMEKGSTVEQIRESADRVHRAGFRIGFFIQFGYPGETFEDVQATLKMIWAARPDDIGISVSYPLPGTPFYERVQAELGDATHWVDSSDLAMLFDGPYSTDFYRALHERVHTEYRLRQVLWALQKRQLPSLGGLARAARDAIKLYPQIRRVQQLAVPTTGALKNLPAELDRVSASTPSEQSVVLSPSKPATAKPATSNPATSNPATSNPAS